MADRRRRQQDLSLNRASARKKGGPSDVGGAGSDLGLSANKTARKTGGGSAFKRAGGTQSRFQATSKKLFGPENVQLNKGDQDLDQFLGPLLDQAGLTVDDLTDQLKLTTNDETVEVAGLRLLTALNAQSSWRQREAASTAYLNYIENGVPDRFQATNTHKLFKASLNVAQICFYDKLLQVYFTGLKILEAAMQSPICGPEITSKEINRLMQPFLHLLVQKGEELNFRVRDQTQQTLLGIFRNNSRADEGKLVDVIMELVNKGLSPEKAPERVILGKLELLSGLISTTGIKQKASWDWKVVMKTLILPSLLSQHSNVRFMAQQLVVLFYQIKGDECRDMVIQNFNQMQIKQGVQDTILKRF